MLSAFKIAQCQMIRKLINWKGFVNRLTKVVFSNESSAEKLRRTTDNMTGIAGSRTCVPSAAGVQLN